MSFIYKVLTIIFILLFYQVVNAKEVNKDDVAQVAIQMLDSGMLDNDPELKKNAAELKTAYQKEQHAKATMEDQRERVEILEEAQRIINQSPERDSYHDVLKRTAKDLNIHLKDAQVLVDRQDPRVIRIWNKMVSEETDKVYKQAAEIVRKRKKIQ